MIGPIKETKGLLLSITGSCETLIKQTHRKAKGTLEFENCQTKRNISFQSTN